MSGGLLVTALVAAYNEERHLGACLKSLQEQSYQPLEVIVADDGSTDGTAAVARHYLGVQLMSGGHVGKARTVNGAAAKALGEILLFLDGDLYFDRDYVKHLVAPIISGAAIGSCHATERVANPTNRWSRCWQIKAGLPPDQRVRISPAELARGSTIFRAVLRERFLAVGGFDDTGHTDDATLHPKLGRTAAFVPDAVCYHHNVETLGEVFEQGVWGGKSVHHRFGARALLSYALPRSLIRALRTALRHRYGWLAAYDIVADAGVFWGVLKRSLGVDRSYAR